ncbi:DNA topoisomerase [Pseudoalteromonas marina]|uniref:DNA topoisomerase n=1 Tax=Pseudoalteromonas marina TaxID=267375 RepID=A0ABT9FK05_9GAMM|nr:DNA topoisomerase [Pseudoalteromonas marina]MDP2567132.1 DNA topoisomerase [Pseudoalteromonas marina]
MILAIFEKSSQCKQVAEALNFKKNGNYYEGTFNNEDYRFVALAGHVLELIPPDTINPSLSWDSIEGLDQLPESIKKVPVSSKKNLLDNVKFAARDADMIVMAADPDRSGASIYFSAINYLKLQHKHGRTIWFSQGLYEDNVKNAFKNFKHSDYSLPYFYADHARAIADYYWMYLVRLYTWFGRKGALSENLGSGGGKSSVVSVGRVQSALVQLINIRDNLVKNYKPKRFYNFNILINGAEFKYTHDAKLNNFHLYNGYIEDRDNVYFTDQMQANNFKKELQSIGTLLINKSNKKPFKENAPDVFSSKDLWSHCSKKLGLGVKAIQAITEALYREGFVSYPRTKGTHIPKSTYSAEFIDNILKTNENFKKDLQKDVRLSISNENFIPNVFRDENSAHDGIIPTGKNISDIKFDSELIKDAKKKTKVSNDSFIDIFNEIYQQFCLACLQPAKGFKCDVVATVDTPNLTDKKTSTFKTSSKFYDDLGYLIWTKDNKDSEGTKKLFIPEEGEEIKFDRVTLKTSNTAKYKHYTETTLPEGMSTISKNIKDPELAKVLKNASGIGTEATIVSIIDTVLAREYVNLSAGIYTITDKGKDLINVIDPQLCSPNLTAAWEQRLKEIEEEKDPIKAKELSEVFIRKQRNFITRKVNEVKAEYIDKLGTFNVVQYSGNGKPSPKQVAFAKKLSKDKKIPLSPKTLNSVVLTSKFITKALDKKG